MPYDLGEPKFSRQRRCNAQDRLERMLDAKTRTIGVDKNALDAQVGERMFACQASRGLLVTRTRST